MNEAWTIMDFRKIVEYRKRLTKEISKNVTLTVENWSAGVRLEEMEEKYYAAKAKIEELEKELNLYNPKLYKELIRDKLISGEPIYSKVGSKAGTTTGVEKPEEPLKQAPSNMYLSSEEEQKRVMEGKKRNTNDD